MHKALKAWADKLQQGAIPAMRLNTEKVRQLSAQEHINMGELAVIIEKDPGLSTHLLNRINTIKHKNLRSEVTTVEHAVMMLGIEQLRSLPDAVPLLEKVENGESRQRLNRIYARSFHAAHLARHLATLRHDMDPAEIYLAAFLHDLGEMLLALYAPKKLQEIESHPKQQSIEPREAEYVVLGFGVDHLSLELGRRWYQPSLMRDSLKAENAANPRVLGVMLAVQIAKAAEQGWYTQKMTKTLEELARHMHKELGEVTAMVHRNAVEAAREAQMYGIPPPAINLIHPSQPEAEPGYVEPEPEVAEVEEDSGGFCLAPQLHILKQSLVKLKTAREDALNLNQILSLAMDGLHDGIGLNRVVFAMRNPDKYQLVSRAIAGADNDPQFSQFVINLHGSHLFSRILDKPQGLWVNDDNRSKIWPMIPPEVYRLIQSNSFYLMSVFVQEKPVGIFYADRHTGTSALDETSYKYFKQVVTLTANAMANLSR